MSRARLLLLTIVAMAVRLHALGAVPLRWDEGWSIALARLPWPELCRLTALDVHPPLYYLLLAPWLSAARAPEAWSRLPSALAGIAAVPLAAAAARAWCRGGGSVARRCAMPAALAVALAPPLVYYAGVARMYALTTPLLLLAAVGLARLAAEGRRRWAVVAAVGTTGSLYTFYYTGFALAGLFAAALLAWPRAWRRTVGVALASAVGYAPWLFYAAPAMLERTAAHTGEAGLRFGAAIDLFGAGLRSALFAHDAGTPALAIVLVVCSVGWFLARPGARIGLVALPTLITLVGAGLGAQAHMFAARYTIVATPFLAIGAAWAIAGLQARSRALAIAAAALVLAAIAPTFAGVVYQRSGEVTGAYDPSADWHALHDHATGSDLVAFNVLSLAGAYDRYRTPSDPPWTYAQVWDPVREPEETAIGRVARRAVAHPRLWLVLYRGTASPGSAALKTWADRALFPAEGWWTDDRLYQSYVTGSADRRTDPGARFDGCATLRSAAHTARVRSGSGVAVDLTWEATCSIARDARVFVHLYDRSGRLVAQHDAYAAADTRPTSTWTVRETIEDRHGLVVPDGAPAELSLRVGLYEPDSGRRWSQADGSDGVTLGAVTVLP